MKAIGKDGKVARLTKESWEILIPFDSDPNAALKKIQAELNKPAIQTANSTPSIVTAQGHTCKFDEGTVTAAIKQGIKETLESFRE